MPILKRVSSIGSALAAVCRGSSTSAVVPSTLVGEALDWASVCSSATYHSSAFWDGQLGPRTAPAALPRTFRVGAYFPIVSESSRLRIGCVVSYDPRGPCRVHAHFGRLSLGLSGRANRYSVRTVAYGDNGTGRKETRRRRTWQPGSVTRTRSGAHDCRGAPASGPRGRRGRLGIE